MEEESIKIVKDICKKYKNTENKDELKDSIIENNIEPILVEMHLNFEYDININLSFNISNKKINRLPFRDKLMKRFDYKCMIDPDNYNLPTDCEACHIIPVHKFNDYNINNGLFMNKLVHEYFDRYELSINPDSNKIELKGKAMEQNQLKRLDGKIINILEKYHAIKYYLTIHYNEFKKK
jgi:predicted restriction endonuclease